MLAIQTILHPTDFSEQSECAFRLACSLARDHGARVVVLHVAPAPLVVAVEAVLPVEPEGYLDELRLRLDQVRPDNPDVVTEYLLARGDSVGEILRAAEETHCDLIVMGTHGRTGLGRLVMGSVAEQVLRRAPCPVLTLKTPSPALLADKAFATAGSAQGSPA